MKKRFLAMLLVVMLIVNIIPTSVFAEAVEQPEVIYGSYQDNNPNSAFLVTGEDSYTDEKTGITVSKVAEPIEDGSDNKYKVTLTVQTSTTTSKVAAPAATVLVIDVSGSMDYCVDCKTSEGYWGGSSHSKDCVHYNYFDNSVKESQSRMTAAKAAAIGFLDSYRVAPANSGRWVSIVKFATNGNVVCDWVDVTTTEGYKSAVETIDGLDANGGTNLEQGLAKAKGQFDKNAVSGVKNKFTIALTDGVPTYAGSSAWGPGSSGREDVNTATAATAATLRTICDNLYTVCVGVAEQTCYNNGPKVGEFLSGSVATNSDCAFNANNAAELYAAFDNITEEITNGLALSGTNVDDTMGDVVDSFTVTEVPVKSERGFTWTLGDPTDVQTTEDADGSIVKTYTYVKSYIVDLDDSQANDHNGYYPLNKEAYLDVDVNTRIYFPVPAVHPEYTVIYDNGDHGKLEGEDKNGQVVTTDLLRYVETPDEPAVTADENYYFIGWDPVRTEKVTRSVTYTAQYAEKSEIVITGESDTVDYNGAEQVLTGYTAPDGMTVTGITYKAAGTDVGTYTGEFAGTPVITVDGVDVTNQYKVKYVPGTLTINPLAVTVEIAGNTATKSYTGAEQSVTGFDVTSVSSTLYIESYIDFTGDATAKRTHVGTTPMNMTAEQFANNNENFTVTFDVTDGALTITRATDAQIEVIPYNGVYDGNAYSALRVTLKDSDGNELDGAWTFEYYVGEEKFDYMPSIKDVGTLTVTVKAFNEDYAPLEATGTAVVTPKAVTLTSANAEKSYDGTPLVKDEVTAEGFVEGEGATYSNFASILDVGETKNTFEFALNKGTKAENYTITVVEGTLKVVPNPAPITITAADATKTYDGTPLTNAGYTYTEKVLKNGDVLTAVVEGTITDVGTAANVVTSYKVVRGETDVTANYTFAESVNGTLTVTPKAVTLTSADASKVYDGTALTAETVTATGFVEGEGATYSNFASITDVGSTANTFAYTLNEGTKAGNYTITKEFGTLTVTPLSGVKVTITENSGEYTYDGTEKVAEGYTVSINNDLYTKEDFKFNGEAVVKGTNVGTYDMNVNAEDFVNTNKNFTNVTFVINDGQLKINPMTGVEVTITENSGEYTYNGKEWTVTGCEVTNISDPLYTVDNFNFNGVALAKGTVVGTYNMNVNAEDFENISDNFADVKFIIVDGQLKIKPISDELVITAASDSKKYDGTALTNDGYTYTEKVLKNGDVLTAVVEGTITNFGTVENKVVSHKILNAAGEDVTKCYSGVKYADGKLSISKRTVTLTSATDSKTYDGTPLTDKKITVTGDGFVKGEGAAYTVTGSRTTVGTSKNTFTYKLNDNTLADNYDVTTIEGTLTVAKKGEIVVTITENSGVYTYDGSEKVVEGYTVSISDPLYTEEDFSFDGEALVAGTLAGTYEMELKAEDFKNINPNFNDVTFVIKEGTLVINPIETEIVITADSNEKVYDGTALTDDGYTFTQAVLVDGDELTAVVKGTITNVGSVDNKVTAYVIKNSEGENVTNCYAKAKYVEGTLTVTKRPVTLISATDSKTYDGTALTAETVTAVGFVEGEGATYSSFASITNVGSTENIFAYTLNEGTKAENYAITIKNGTLTVSPSDEVIVTITEHSGVYTYDGTEKTVAGYDVSISNPLYTEDYFTFSGVASVSGTKMGTYPMELTVENFTNVNTNNFPEVSFVIVDGELVINPVEAEIVVAADSDSKMYDGTALTNDGYAFTDGVLANGDVLTAVVEGTITNVGTVENKVVSHKIVNANGVDVTDCYSYVIYENGALSITKRIVTLTSATESKTYDGEALTNDEITVGGDGFVEGEGAAYDVTGSQTEAGSSKNTFTYALNENTLAGNYDITTTEGTLTVAKKGEIVVTITENSGVETYDGTKKVVEGYTVSISDPLYTEEDFTFSGNDLIAGTLAGTYEMELKPEDFANTNENFENVTFVIVDGALEIKPIEAALVIIVDSVGKIYDGTALTSANYSFNEEVLVEGDELIVVIEGSITDVGSVENAVTDYKIVRKTAEGDVAPAAEIDVTDCYANITVVNGTLTVKPRELILTSGSAAKVYDGTPLTSYEITAEGFVEGEGALVTFTGAQLNAGVSENTFTYELNENTKAENYTVIIVNGKLEVTPKAVTITSGSATKNYDEKALTSDKIVAEGFVEGEGAEYTITGSQTEVGTGKNTFTYKLKENTLAENYVITIVEGDLVVEPPIEIPDTGDTTNLVLYAGMMVVSAAAFVALLVIGKKKFMA